MINNSAMLLWLILLSGCAGNELSIANNQGNNRGYFADATQCSQSSMRKEQILLPNPGAAGAIEIPLGYDPDLFIVCMEHAGRPVSRADLTEYLNVSTICLDEARGAENPDEDYANCVKRSDLSVEILK